MLPSCPVKEIRKVLLCVLAWGGYAGSVVAQDQAASKARAPESVVAKSGEQYDEYHSSRLPDSYPMSNPSSGSYTDAYAASSAYARPGYQAGYGAEYEDPFSEARARVPDYVADGEYRKPANLCFVTDALALVSTEASGQIFSVDAASHVVSEFFAEEKASFGQMAVIDATTIAVLDRAGSRVLLLELTLDDPEHPKARKSFELDAPGLPSAVAWDDLRKELLVTGTWSQRLYRWRLEKLDVDTNHRWQVTHRQSADLPMCGGQLLVLPKSQSIMVVDAFGRDYVMLQLDSLERINHQKLYGHNVTGLLATADEEFVFFPHQLLNEFARSVTTDITWGGLMSNNIRWLRTERLLNEQEEQVFKKGRFLPLGTPGNGAGDPSSIARSDEGLLAVTLAGTNRVALGSEADYYFRQYAVGYRPVDCEFSPSGDELWVVNKFSDSLTCIDVESGEQSEIELGPLRSPTIEERGEQFFFSSQLSHDGWMSCHSCHSEGHTNGQLNDNFSDQTFGTPKRILTLRGQADTAPYAWNGKIDSLEKQVGHSIVSTMAGAEPPQDVIVSIARFVATLENPPSLADARAATKPSDFGNSEHEVWATKIRKGHQQFTKLGCAECHAGKNLTSPETYDVGLVDEANERQFNPPSLRGVSQRQTALLHDGRAGSLSEVFEKEQHQLDAPLTKKQLGQLVAYLQSL
ncbi:MAG: cytochrome c peroxidase [Aureliella sp.]